VLAKKGTREPTTLSYGAALEEALCHGWIDGQVRRRDEATYKQRFTPRRARSQWSKRNIGIAERLAAEGRMHASGHAEIERAKSDGRWEAAYAGPASIEVPDDLAAALRKDKGAAKTFEAFSPSCRREYVDWITEAKREETRKKRLEQTLEWLAEGKKRNWKYESC